MSPSDTPPSDAAGSATSAFLEEAVSVFRPGLFAGSVVLVSGATSGIGLEIARGFRRLGAEVLATGSSPTKLAALTAQDQDGIRFARLDVRDEAQIRDVLDTLPRLDVLVNAAGVARPGAEWEGDTFDDVIGVNLSSVMHMSRLAKPMLAATRGSIVNIASMLSFLADADVPAYCASKTGLLGLTRALAHGWGPDGIRVNAIAPGYHETDMTRPLWSQPHNRAVIQEQSALKRWGRTADLVGATLFLASPAAGFVTGTCLAVDGGYSVKAVVG
ncbi:SDR family NAD(P)-dependent oxidoreductase [Rhizosaccharibacter radicis]|uniref:SDR family oxidoreductase n=1 Tax=Rhizosaccharibacter radicis TaxID=2782605 RepID=A0ABT1W0Y6_9PROT|nr:SDR family oxidoreductase [Acetobacteraceae bacterium KSS12]